jgi:hypothetical protein
MQGKAIPHVIRLQQQKYEKGRQSCTPVYPCKFRRSASMNLFRQSPL